QEVRGGGERAGQLETLLVHQRQLGGSAERLALEPDQRQQALGLGGGVTSIAPAAVQETEAHVVERGEPRKRPHQLKCPRDAGAAHAMRLPARDVVTLEANLAGVRSERSRDQVEERRLA